MARQLARGAQTIVVQMTSHSASTLADAKSFLATEAFVSCQKTWTVRSFVSFAIHLTANYLATFEFERNKVV